jgi:hypothetical protein
LAAAQVTLAAIDVPVAITVVPATITLQAGGGLQLFVATVVNTTITGVTWTVNDILGGSAVTGTISATGLYTAPALMPNPAAVTVAAVSLADPTRRASATVNLTAAPVPMTVSISPLSASVPIAIGTQAFVATVSNTTDIAVIWQVNNLVGGSAVTGTISAAGLYTAPKTYSEALKSVWITAVSATNSASFATATVTVTVATPSLGGTPPTSVLVGQPYVFKPIAFDPDGLALSFSITGAPEWALLDSTTGWLTGTADADDVGTSMMTMTASNGLLSSSLTFPVTVAPLLTFGFATVFWTAPTTNTDGTALTNLAGFNIYYGMEQADLEEVVAVTDPSVLSIAVRELAFGVWYFQVTAVNTDGIESDASVTVSKDITASDSHSRVRD